MQENWRITGHFTDEAGAGARLRLQDTTAAIPFDKTRPRQHGLAQTSRARAIYCAGNPSAMSTYRLLSFDGGGIWDLLSLILLQRLEKELPVGWQGRLTGRHVHRGIIAFGLAHGVTSIIGSANDVWNWVTQRTEWLFCARNVHRARQTRDQPH